MRASSPRPPRTSALRPLCVIIIFLPLNLLAGLRLVALLATLIIIFSKSRWLVIGSWAVAALAVIGLFAYHANDVLELSF